MLNLNLIRERGKLVISSRLFSGGMWMLVGRVSTLFLGLAVSGFLARILSPVDMGTFVFVESLVLTSAIFAQLGLGHTSVRLIARSVANGNFTATRKTIFYVLQWGVLGAAVAALSLFFIGPYIGIPKDVILWASGWVIIFAAQQLLADIFRGFQDFRNVVLIGGSKIGGMITTGIAATLLYVIWRTLGSLELAEVLPFLLVGGLPTILFAAASLSRKTQLRGRSADAFEKQSINISRTRILWLAFPVLITTVTATFLSKSGIWITAAFRPSAEVAIFGVAARLVAIVSLPMNFFETLISPTIVDLYTDGKVRKLENLLRGITTILALFSIVVFIIFVLIGSDILGFVYGDFYRAGAGVLILLVAGSVASVITGPCGMTLVMTGNQTALMAIDIASSMLSVVLMFVLVNPWGIIGVASAIALGTIVKNIIMLLLVKKLTGMWTHLTFNLSEYHGLDWLR